MEKMILFILSILPVALVGMYIYKKDKNKEPSKLLAKLFFSGFSAIFITLLLSSISELIFPLLSKEPTELNLINLILYVFVGVALIEEFSKWIMTYLISYNNIEFDEEYDMIVYATFVSLGFACFENILYVQAGGITTGIVRAFLAIPGHACNGIIMGYYLGLAKLNSIQNEKKLCTKNKILSLFIPILVHGLYDYCLFAENIYFFVLFIISIVMLYIYSIKKVNNISKCNQRIKYKDNYCSICGYKVESDYCPNCGRKNI